MIRETMTLFGKLRLGMCYRISLYTASYPLSQDFLLIITQSPDDEQSTMANTPEQLAPYLGGKSEHISFLCRCLRMASAAQPRVRG